MLYFESIFLGCFQGIIEFFPISSSGHLILYQAMGGDSLPLQHKLFDAVVQIGSGLALLVFFYREFTKGNIALLEDKKLSHCIKVLVLASLPVILSGILFHSFIKETFYSPLIVASMLIGGGILFLYAEKKYRTARSFQDPTDLRIASTIGFFQAAALIPGVSRSGATIMGGQLLNVSRKDSILFSFCIAIPILIGAGTFDLLTVAIRYSEIPVDLYDLILGASSAFFTSFFVAKGALAFLTRHGLIPFAWYRIGIGLIVFWYQIIQPSPI